MTAPIAIADIETDAERFDASLAAGIYRRHGCLVVRGLMRPWLGPVLADIQAAVQVALGCLPTAAAVDGGWRGGDGTLFLPAPAGSGRARQIMLLPCSYRRSAALLRSALDDRALDLAEAVFGADVELFGEGQVLYKEGSGGHPKHLHQDSAYFQHRCAGPMTMLAYGVDTTVGNGALHLVPASHRLGLLPHVDTCSHLGLDAAEWPWSRALAIEGRAGDAIFFHADAIHGSPENTSSSPRPVFLHRYRAADDFVVAYAKTVGNRAATSARKADDVGLLVRGFRRNIPA
jgi:phytanoyl-CoA hydroxylase